MLAKVIRFPVEARIPARIAEEKLGAITIYGRSHPEWDRVGGKKLGFVGAWLEKKSVLFGWETVREGLVHSFKGGRVRHILSAVDVDGYKDGRRPRVELCCGYGFVPVWNWNCESVSDLVVDEPPAVLLSIDQEKYFRLCKNCEKILGR